MSEKEKPIDWGFRVMHNVLSEYVIPGKDVFEGIEDALTALKAERDKALAAKAFIETVELEPLRRERDTLQQRVVELEAENLSLLKANEDLQSDLSAERFDSWPQERISQLEAENARLNSEAQRWYKRYHEASAQLTAHTAAEQWEVDWCEYPWDEKSVANEHVKLGWKPIAGHFMDGIEGSGIYVYILWQRPARQQT